MGYADEGTQAIPDDTLCFFAFTMKASCGDEKSEGRETQEGSVPSLIEMAPLLCIPHVANDSGKPGLLSNRVAFHEKFTVSPQRFAQLSASCRSFAAPSSCSECALKECHHLSTLHMPVVPTSRQAQGLACRFFGTMDGTTMCDSKFAGRNTPLDTAAMTMKGDKLENIAAKTAHAELPSNHTMLDKAESNAGQTVCDTPAADVMKPVEGAQYLSIGDGLQSVSDLKKADLASQSEGYAFVGCGNAEDGGEIIAKDEVLLTVSKEDQNASCIDRRSMRALSNECCSDSSEMKRVAQSKGSDTEGLPLDRCMLNDVEVPGPCNAEGHMVTIKDDLGHCKESSPDARCVYDSLIESISKIEVETVLPSRDTDAFVKPMKGLSSILDRSCREDTVKAARETPCISERNKCGACEESANKNSYHSGVLESSPEDMDAGNSSSDSETSCASSLSPKVVIQEIGQLRFWKARLALIRQQRIFSDQVFELHKLIEVQRLLAGTYTSIDEIYFGVGNMNLECDVAALACDSHLGDKIENVGDGSEKQALVSKQAVEVPMVTGEAKIKSVNSQAVAGAKEGGLSVWGNPSLGIGHWPGSSPAVGAHPCPPFAGGCTLGSAVDSPFAAPVVGLEGEAKLQSPMFPFSFPVCLQKPQLTQSAQSSYESAIASAHLQHSAPHHTSSVHEVSNHSRLKTLNKMGGTAEGPTPSVATISSQPDTSQQRVKKDYPSSFNSQQDLQEEGVQPGRQGFTMSGSKPEDLRHIVTGLILNSSAATPANELWECSEHDEHGLSQALDMTHHDNDAEKKESLLQELRGCKRQKEKQQDSLTTGKSVDVNKLLNPSLGPLNLFPLAPTLSLDEQRQRRSSGGAK